MPSKSIHVAADSKISLFHDWIDSHSVCMYDTFFHSSVDELLGRFRILAIVNKIATNIEVHVSFQI